MNQRQLECQRNLYKLLLCTIEGHDISVEDCFTKALSIVIEITGARLGYIEFRNKVGERWWSTHQCSDDDIEMIRNQISTGIIAEAIESNETIVTPSAFLDPRFSARDSVQVGKIEAVLCSPISDGESVGVIYLQGDNDADFDSEPCMMETELFGRHIVPLLRRLRFQIESQEPRDTIRQKYHLEGIIGESKQFLKILNEAMAIAEIDVSVLITGATGTGKSMLAKAIHQNSLRRDYPFVHLNCTNLPEALVESELFGAVRGAHSSAHRDIKGKIAAADKGTLFLDEIGDLPISIQAKLLQFLEEGLYYQLGSQILTKADIRIITASNIDFKKAIKQGAFREDLYYRICVFPLEMPSLRHRNEDIPTLLKYFTEKYCERYKLPHVDMSQQLIQMFQESEWPGNIRELENKVQQGILRAKAETSNQIRICHFLTINNDKTSSNVETTTYREEKESWEKRFIYTRLEKYKWNITETALSLNLSRSHMNNLIKQHQFERAINKDE